MNSGRMPACIDEPLPGENNTGVLQVHVGNDTTKSHKKNQLFLHGNRCGHDKKNYRFPTFKANHQRRYHVIEELKRKITQSHLSYDFQSETLGKLYYRANGRKRRSEAKESILTLVLYALIHDCNLHNMQYGQYIHHSNTFNNYDYGYIQKVTGCSEIRIKRSIEVLKFLGWVTVQPIIKELNDGHFITEKVMIILSDDIFKTFGLYEEFLKDRERVSIRFHKRNLIASNNERRKNLYIPRRIMKDKSDIKNPIRDLSNSLRPDYSQKYNAASDKQITYLTMQLLKEKIYPDARSAMIEACRRLGKPPPT
jgi:hypothetical protein